MIRPVVWLPEAVAEPKKAKAWYAEIRPELATRFAHAVDETVAKLARDPLHFAVVKKNRRRAGVHRFPYGLFFIVEQDRIVVLACFHGKRNPRRWLTRPIISPE